MYWSLNHHNMVWVHKKATTYSYILERSSSAIYSSLYQPLQIKMDETHNIETLHDNLTAGWNHTNKYKNLIFIDNCSGFKASYSCCAEPEHYLVSKINKSLNTINRRTAEETDGRKCKPGYCGVGVWYSSHVQKVHLWPYPRLGEQWAEDQMLSPNLKRRSSSSSSKCPWL